MRVADMVDVARAFAEQDIRYLIVGGLAVVAHGYVRTTVDVDIVLDLSPDNVARALIQLEHLGYRSRVPVPMADFGLAENRERWQREKDTLAFTVLKGSGPWQCEIDLFLREPFPFAEAYAAALVQMHASQVPFRFVDLNRLRQLKRAAGRPKDLADLAALAMLHGDDQTAQ